jgi:tetratricopeptide (TPR) repeat protein
MGDYEKSMRDCERALKLNPNHYGAWQGLGVCELELGRLNEACEALRAALRITPHDEATLRSLQQCEKLLRSRSTTRREQWPSDIL